MANLFGLDVFDNRNSGWGIFSKIGDFVSMEYPAVVFNWLLSGTWDLFVH